MIPCMVWIYSAEAGGFIGKKVNTREIFIAIYVLRPQQWAPVSIMQHFWAFRDEGRADFIAKELSEMNLVILDTYVISCDDGATVGVRLHDLVLEYCRKEVERCGGHKNLRAKLLDGYSAASRAKQMCDEYERYEVDEVVEHGI